LRMNRRIAPEPESPLDEAPRQHKSNDAKSDSKQGQPGSSRLPIQISERQLKYSTHVRDSQINASPDFTRVTTKALP
ncbi:MAG: hypothetical protein KA779_03230, partial [Propionivibrio sp.]|nr:hypothetical protein [Propionivibrio sp.]